MLVICVHPTPLFSSTLWAGSNGTTWCRNVMLKCSNPLLHIVLSFGWWKWFGWFPSLSLFFLLDAPRNRMDTHVLPQ